MYDKIRAHLKNKFSIAKLIILFAHLTCVCGYSKFSFSVSFFRVENYFANIMGTFASKEKFVAYGEPLKLLITTIYV